MKNKKKGFTLVELLAVIVILAVIILIAVTAVIPRMNKAKKSSFMNEVLIYLKTAKQISLADGNQTCYNISELDEYISKKKDGYSGVLFVNQKGEYNIHLSNGEFYIVTDGYPYIDDIKDTKPAQFVSSCTDTSKSYTITYDLGGGTVSSANPTSYTANTPTFTLNNPTKAGYRFVGWSSKNLFDEKTLLSEIASSEYTDGFYVFTSANLKSLYGTANGGFPITGFKTGTRYAVSIYGYNVENNSNSNFRIYYKYSNDTTSNFVFNLRSYGKKTSASTSGKDLVNIYANYNSSTKNYIRHIQVEQGASVTDFQEYMEPTTNAKVYRGSVGNKKFIANWQAI